MKEIRKIVVQVIFLFLFLVYYVQWVIEKVGPLMKGYFSIYRPKISVLTLFSISNSLEHV